MVYSWKEGSHINLDPEKVKKEFDKIGECLTAERIVSYAKKQNSELHKGFEWDDSIAAQKFRLSQARHFINCLIVIPENSTQEMRCYENIIIKDEKVYAPIEMILKDEDLFNQVYDEIKSGIINLDNKLQVYEKQFKKLHNIRKNISSIRKEIEVLT